MRAFFEARRDVVVEQLNETELEVSLLGSFNPKAHRQEVERLLRAVPAGSEPVDRGEASLDDE